MTALERADWLAELWAAHVEECARCTETQAGCLLGEDTDWLLVRAVREGRR